MKKSIILAVSFLTFSLFAGFPWNGSYQDMIDYSNTEECSEFDKEAVKVVTYIFNNNNIIFDEVLKTTENEAVILATALYGTIISKNVENSIYPYTSTLLKLVLTNSDKFKDNYYFLAFILGKHYLEFDLEFKQCLQLSESEIFELVSNYMIRRCNDVIASDDKVDISDLNDIIKIYNKWINVCGKDAVKAKIEEIDVLAYQMLAISSDYKKFAVRVRAIKNSLNQ